MKPPRLPVALIAAALLLTACGSSGPDEDGAAAAPSSSSFPVTVDHAFGSTTVEQQPVRVVTAGYTEQDTVLALGITPVGVTEWYGEQPYATWPWAQAALGDARPTVLSATDSLEYEKIAGLRPDLIIATNAGLDRQSYDRLSRIAPTIAHSGKFTEYFEPWDVQAIAAGTALGKKPQVTELVADVKKKFADARAAHPEFTGKKAVFLQNAFYNGNAIAYQDGLSTDFLTDLGFVVPKELDRFQGEGQAEIPLEQLDVLNTADVLLWGTEKPADRTALEQEKLYRELDRVKDGHLVFTDGVTAGAIYFTSLLSLPYVVDRLVPAFADTLAGQGPSTIGD
jgi:iron complex transport system substrate-binding protein